MCCRELSLTTWAEQQWHTQIGAILTDLHAVGLQRDHPEQASDCHRTNRDNPPKRDLLCVCVCVWVWNHHSGPRYGCAAGLIEGQGIVAGAERVLIIPVWPASLHPQDVTAKAGSTGPWTDQGSHLPGGSPDKIDVQHPRPRALELVVVSQFLNQPLGRRCFRACTWSLPALRIGSSRGHDEEQWVQGEERGTWGGLKSMLKERHAQA